MESAGMVEVAKPTETIDPALRAIVERITPGSRELIHCAVCSYAIARVSDRIEVSGAHAHHLTNPFGYRFDVGCFGEALGCSLAGISNAADTWFPGFRWRLATCAECHQQLGWYFDQRERYFYGLIRDRIQEG